MFSLFPTRTSSLNKTTLSSWPQRVGTHGERRQRRLVEVTTQRAACAKQRQESATEVALPHGVGWMGYTPENYTPVI